jgi:RND family efflux transporter MFP subunit
MKPIFIRFTRKRTVAVAAVVAAVTAAAVVLAGVADKPARIAAPAAVPRVLEFSADDLVLARSESLARTVPVTGTLAALNQAVVKTRAPGLLTDVLAREGEAVRKGQVLARVEEIQVRAQVAEREAEVAAADAQLGWSQRNLAQQKALLDKGFISPNAFDNVRNSEQVAQARLDAAHAQLAQTRKALADLQLPSPISGIVAQRHAEPGERLPADAPVLTVVSLERLELAADVPVVDIARVSVGQRVNVRVDGFEGRVFSGRVERINPQATAGAGVVPIYVVVDNADGTLKAGLFAHGQVVLSAQQAAIVIPASAVHEGNGERYVYAVENGTVAKRAVQVSFVADGRASITSGLSAGTQVVAANLGQLPVGAQARVAGQEVAARP